MTRRTRFARALISSVAAAGAAAAVAGPASTSAVPAGDYIVTLRPGSPAEAVTTRLAHRYSLHPRGTYRRVLPGFSASLTSAQAIALRSDPSVEGVYPDGVVQAPPMQPIAADFTAAAQVRAKSKQEVPTGVSRCGALLSPTAAIDGKDSRLNVDVAVIDSGISSHPELRIAGGVNFQSSGKPVDQYGHGTHVAGIIGARDNKTGVVGMAPGCRLWAVRVLDERGLGTWSGVIRALDWVTERAGKIRLVNLSVLGSISDPTPLRRAVEACLAAGVTLVCVAGNQGVDLGDLAPASFDGVITVSAMADSDGRGGPSAGLFYIPNIDLEELDESRADFSNFGPRMDLTAPGVNILSTSLRRGYRRISGTSQAGPHVTGAAALYLARHPDASPAEVKAAILGAALPFAPPDDPDGIHEPILDVSTF